MTFLENYNRFSKEVLREDNDKETMGLGYFPFVDAGWRNIKQAGFEDVAETFKDVCKVIKEEGSENLLRRAKGEGYDSGVQCPLYLSFYPDTYEEVLKGKDKYDAEGYEKNLDNLIQKIKKVKGVKKVTKFLGPSVADYPRTTTAVRVFFDTPSDYQTYDDKKLEDTRSSNYEKIKKGDIGGKFSTGNENTAAYNFATQALMDRNRIRDEE